MGATIEWIVGIVRVGEDHKVIGDEFTASGYILKDMDKATIKGLSDHLPDRFIEDLRNTLMREGIMHVSWKSKEASGLVEISKDL